MNTIQAQAALNIEALRNAHYPGRGMAMGLTPSGGELVQIYWTMGRSAGSKNRLLVRDGEQVKTVLKDTTVPVEHEELIVYNVTARAGDAHILSNGRQTDTIREFIAAGRGFEEALYNWKYEEDPPILTPRISGVFEGGSGRYKLSIIKALEREEKLPAHQFYCYRAAVSGFGHCLHTYAPGKVTYPFAGEPYWVPIFEAIEENADAYWEILPPDKRVGLYVKHIRLSDMHADERIINA